MGCGNESCLNHSGHMTKMATMPIYGKNPSKIFFSGTIGPMTLKLGIQHWGLGPYKNYSNDELGLTFTARSTLLPNAFVWEGFIEAIEAC